MTAPALFSLYKTDENRITGSFMAVLQRLQLPFTERLLSAFTQEAGSSLVEFNLQTTQARDSVPDGEIRAGVRWLLEVKIVPDSVDASQLQRHLAQLDGTYPDERLLVLSPDPVEPFAVQRLGDDRVAWASFAQVAAEIESMTADPTISLSERDDFLLRELLVLFHGEGLLDHDDTVVLAARDAWPEYNVLHAYVCQPNRSFRTGLTHLAFYADGEIKPLVPRILASRPDVLFTHESAAAIAAEPDGAAIATLVQETLSRNDGRRLEGERYGVFILSGPDDPETVKLEQGIRNTTTTRSGRRWAWTLGQRYTRLEHLRAGYSTTSELDAAGR